MPFLNFALYIAPDINFTLYIAPDLQLDANGNATMEGWQEKFISLTDAVLWSAAYFTVKSGSIVCHNGSGDRKRFVMLVDLCSPTVNANFEHCNQAATGFCITIHSLNGTIKIAPKRFKALLEWGAVLWQSINLISPSIDEGDIFLPMAKDAKGDASDTQHSDSLSWVALYRQAKQAKRRGKSLC